LRKQGLKSLCEEIDMAKGNNSHKKNVKKPKKVKPKILPAGRGS
jgi:hypothetical protein